MQCSLIYEQAFDRDVISYSSQPLKITYILDKNMAVKSFYDCESPRPEMAGFHNMVLFGKPDDRLYAYHLPLFAGDVNGQEGHVLMHIYQGIWAINLDEITKVKYFEKFEKEKSDQTPFPFFSFSPREPKFKVPEMFCNPDFATSVFVVFGHIENNPNFPPPEPLLEGNQLSQIKVKGEPVFARRFDGSTKEDLTYILFGTAEQLYLAHYLTDNENSFDQIVSVSTEDFQLKEIVKQNHTILTSVEIAQNQNLVPVPGHETLKSLNNRLALPTSPLGQQIILSTGEQSFSVKITGFVYYNQNNDLAVSN